MNQEVFATNVIFTYIVNISILFLSPLFAEGTSMNDVFRQNIGDLMEIGIPDGGYKSARLKCGTDYMAIDLETEEEFLGVIYTRGSFHDKETPCFYDTGNRRGQRSFQLRLPFDKCKTKQDGDVYSNVLVLQHDKELIMPGDVAFNLECDFSKPRDITVKADMYNDKVVKSRIALTDPSSKVNKIEERSISESYTNSVIITPELAMRPKEEL